MYLFSFYVDVEIKGSNHKNNLYVMKMSVLILLVGKHLYKIKRIRINV